MVNGVAEKSCDYTVGAAAGKAITTIEGLSPDGSHPLQKAWIAEQAPQCGYCQSGMIMQAAALLREKPHPSDGDINGAMKNICVCGTYQRVKAAIKRAAAGG
jgi:isoquinoline 1-oxidoreductase alpha subunit